MAKKTGFKGSTFRHIKQELRSDIINAPESMPNLRTEIKRVFQMANRRIQNIEKRGEFSPAVISLGKGDITGYSKFQMTGNSWVELKKEYTKAITFLRQPTSTATGTAQYNNHLRETYDLSKEEYAMVSDNLHNKLQSIADSDYVERYLMRYKDFTGELQSEAKDIASQLETDAVKMVNELDEEIEQSTIDALRESEELTQRQIQNIIDKMDELDLL